MCLAVPGKIVSVTEGDELLRQGRIDFGGIVKTVSLACVPEATVGQYVLVHVGMAISLIDEVEARRTFDYLNQIGELMELETGQS